jgi:hypothetical protein
LSYDRRVVRISVWLALSLGALAAARAPAGSPAGEGADTVRVTLDDSSYADGDTIRVAVTNATGRAVWFAAACDLGVEAQERGGWRIAYEPDCSHVRVRPTRLGAGETTVLPFATESLAATELASRLPLRVRLRFQHEDDAGYRFSHSRPFRVTPR